jgi:hypothetical protein
MKSSLCTKIDKKKSKKFDLSCAEIERNAIDLPFTEIDKRILEPSVFLQ